jgi:hypothetical protein
MEEGAMPVLRRVKTLAVIVITLLSFHWLTPALQRKSPVAATSKARRNDAKSTQQTLLGTQQNSPRRTH